jgi:hypothetical protein
MRMTTKLSLVSALAALMLAPETARADGFVIPWIGGNVGSRAAGGFTDFGVSAGYTAASVVDFDVDFDYSPDFYAGRFSSYVLTTMGNVSVGIPFGPIHAPRFRPYVTGGLGLIRSRITDRAFGYSIGSNDLGVNVGGGVTSFFGTHFGLRADIRHIRSVGDDGAAYPPNQFGPGPIRFWRTSVGLVIR